MCSIIQHGAHNVIGTKPWVIGTKPLLVFEQRSLGFTAAEQPANPAAPSDQHFPLCALHKLPPESREADTKQMRSGRDNDAALQRGSALTGVDLGSAPCAINLGDGNGKVAFACQIGDGDMASGILNDAAEITVIMAPA